MAIEGAKELAGELAAIKQGKPRPVYLVFGSEPYLVRTASEAIVDALATTSQAEVERVDAAGRSPDVVLQPVATLSLFASAKVIVVRNFAHLLTGTDADRLLGSLDAGIGAGSALVFVAPGTAPGDKIDKRVKGYRGLAKRGAAIELNEQRPETLTVWLREKAGEDKKKLSSDAAALLLDRVGPNMEALRRELDKALLYCLDQQEITALDLENLVGKSREDAIWDVSEAVAKRDPIRAMTLVEDLLATGTYPLVLLTLLVRQARHVLQARLLWEQGGRPAFRDMRSFQARAAKTFESGAFGRGPDDVTTIHPFAGFKRFEAAQNRELDELRRTLVRLRQADLDVKTGAAAGAREVLEELVLDLCAAGRARRTAA
jgi:DNA polymerase-3 subunit delta